MNQNPSLGRMNAALQQFNPWLLVFRLELELERDKRERDQRERELRERELREMEMREKLKAEMDLKPPGMPASKPGKTPSSLLALQPNICFGVARCTQLETTGCGTRLVSRPQSRLSWEGT